MKKFFIIILFFNLSYFNVYSIEPDIFIQSTVDRASQTLSKNISKQEKIDELKFIAKEAVDIRGIGFYSLGSNRKNLNDNQKKNI
jgi:phospholipid transport system substrate-binding protein